MQAELVDLSSQDLANLLIEAPDTPMQMGILMLFDGDRLLAPDGSLDLQSLTGRIAGRVEARPELRQVLRASGPLGGQATWEERRPVLEEHVRLALVPPPGGERELLITVESLIAMPLSRARPLWEMWFLSGLENRRLGVLLSVHHAVADGLGMLRIATSLLDPEVPAAGRLPRSTVQTGAGAARRHPARGLNHPIGRGRRLGVLRLRLDEVKEVAHAHSAKVGELVLHLAASGLRAALVARGTEVEGRVANALVAVDPRRPDDPLRHRNQAGSVIVSLPLSGPSGAKRLERVCFETRRARRQQRFSTVESLMVLTVLSGLGRQLSRRQAVVQLAVSNLKGPAGRLALFGAPMLEAVPITPISGNVTINFCALSYAGGFEIAVLGEAAAWPDLEAVLVGMREAWEELRSR